MLVCAALPRSRSPQLEPAVPQHTLKGGVHEDAHLSTVASLGVSQEWLSACLVYVAAHEARLSPLLTPGTRFGVLTAGAAAGAFHVALGVLGVHPGVHTEDAEVSLPQFWFWLDTRREQPSCE